ncbi:MAG: hypothetical protein ABIE74_10930 [Pseudomonadota bacterium]
MTKAFKTTEIHIETTNQPGTLLKMTSPITEAGVNLNACCAYGTGNEAHFMFVTNDNEKATGALTKAGYKPTTTEVVVIETTNETGALNTAAAKLATAGININYCYATTGNEGTTWIVFATEDPNKTLKTIS